MAGGTQRIARLTPLTDVLGRIDATVGAVLPRRMATARAVGRVLAEDVIGAAAVPAGIRALRDGFAVAAVLSAVAVLAFVALARALPGAWPAAAAPGAALLVLALGFAGPIVLEPLFNRFRPLGDPALAGELRALAENAGVPVRDVLVADASRRTRRENAYVSGLGGTRRIVLFDNLLDASEPRQIRLVVAHELGHRRAGHVERGTLLGMAGSAAVVLVLWGLLSWPALLEAIGAFGPGDPRVAPFLFLVVGVFEIIGLPLGAALSRRWEREADRSSLELTRDPEAFESAHRRLARANLADLEPPRAVYGLLFSHPTPPERIAAARAWARRATKS